MPLRIEGARHWLAFSKLAQPRKAGAELMAEISLRERRTSRQDVAPRAWPGIRAGSSPHMRRADTLPSEPAEVEAKASTSRHPGGPHRDARNRHPGKADPLGHAEHLHRLGLAQRPRRGPRIRLLELHQSQPLCLMRPTHRLPPHHRGVPKPDRSSGTSDGHILCCRRSRNTVLLRSHKIVDNRRLPWRSEKAIFGSRGVRTDRAVDDTCT